MTKEIKAKYRKKVYEFSLRDAIKNGEAEEERVKEGMKKIVGDDVEELLDVIEEEVERVNEYSKAEQRVRLERIEENRGQ